jgi:hypothetical protein
MGNCIAGNNPAHTSLFFCKLDQLKQASSLILTFPSPPAALRIDIDRRGGFGSMPTSGKLEMGCCRSGRWGRHEQSMMNRPRKPGRQRWMAMESHFFRPEGSKASYPAVAGSDVDGWRRPKPRKLRPWCGVASIIFVVGVVVGCGRRLWARSLFRNLYHPFLI